MFFCLVQCLVAGASHTILQEQDDLNVIDVLAELLFLPQRNPVDTWATAATVAKSTQNLNRTHPLRIEGMDMADKLRRVEERRMRNEARNEMRNSKEFDNY